MLSSLPFCRWGSQGTKMQTKQVVDQGRNPGGRVPYFSLLHAAVSTHGSNQALGTWGPQGGYLSQLLWPWQWAYRLGTIRGPIGPISPDEKEISFRDVKPLSKDCSAIKWLRMRIWPGSIWVQSPGAFHSVTLQLILVTQLLRTPFLLPYRSLWLPGWCEAYEGEWLGGCWASA